MLIKEEVERNIDCNNDCCIDNLDNIDNSISDDYKSTVDQGIIRQYTVLSERKDIKERMEDLGYDFWEYVERLIEKDLDEDILGW